MEKQNSVLTNTKWIFKIKEGGKVLKLPFEIKPKKEKIVVRVSGKEDLFIEDYLPYKGESEWLKIDSDEITYFLADHQDQCDTIEIMYE